MKHNVCILAGVAVAALLATQQVGCASDSTTPGREKPRTGDVAQHIPADAAIVKEGRGEIAYTADADGTVYVQNVPRERFVVSHAIRRGQAVVVSPAQDRVRLNDETIYDADLKRNDAHRIYLLAAQPAARDGRSTQPAVP